ncbi:MAG: hypothetical protein E7Y34_01365, partial [Mycoplasma sp.]|nr:hypothetical protein [Mycoplasma sp.]
MFSSNIDQYSIEEKVDLIAHKLKLHTEFTDKEADDVRIANQDTFFEMRRYSGLDHMIFKVYPPRLSDYNNYDKFSIYPSFGINNKKYYWGMGEGLPSNLISFNNEKFQKQFINRNYNTPFFGISRQNTYNDLSLTDLENLYIGTNT